MTGERERMSRRQAIGAGVLIATGLGGKGFAMDAKTKPAVAGGYAKADGIGIYHEVHGGPLRAGEAPFLLIPGGVMAIETAFTGRSLLPLLARRRPVIAIEQQGHGHTADRPGPVTLERLSDDVAAVMDHLGVARAHLVGHSLGGMAAIGAAMRHPDRCASVTAISAGYTLDGFLPELAALQRDPSRVPSPELQRLLPTEADFQAWKALYDRVAPDPKAFEAVLGKLNATLTSWPGWSAAELGGIGAPALVVIGDDDFIRIEHAAEMKRLIPGAQLAVLPGTTHMSIIDRGDWLAPLIEARI
jgi:pimeloyl-ACP methyl ester carboxylesterase